MAPFIGRHFLLKSKSQISPGAAWRLLLSLLDQPSRRFAMLSMFARPEDKSAPPKTSGPAKAPSAHAPKAAAAASKPTIRLINQAAANANPPRHVPERQSPERAIVQQSALDRRTPSIGQYLHHLQHDIRSYVKAETLNAVIGTTPAEVQRVARILAKLKGRYLAQLVDLGNGANGPIGEPEIRDLRRCREMYEEVELGLNTLRAAIEAGDLELDGIRGE
jgi:hypothetical protein